LRLSQTLSKLAAMRERMATYSPAANAGRLTALADIPENPGNLLGWIYVPAGLKRDAPLVVVLHGCTQSAADYDHGSGWSHLADRHGFALLFPEQQRINNPLLCFNWFEQGDAQRGRGEAASIRSMVDVVVGSCEIDPKRIFVTGLSAGGAMASVMLATYPEVFAAGAIIAGLPFGLANDAAEAFDVMGGRARARVTELAAKVRHASPHRGPWPRVSVWQGSADHTVAPSNADAVVQQWAKMHGLSAAHPSRVDTVEGYPHKVWLDEAGHVAIEQYEITGMAHGTPLRPGTGEGESGEAGAHMLDAQISSTDRIAAFFGIAPEPAQRPRRAAHNPPAANAQAMLEGVASAAKAHGDKQAAWFRKNASVQDVIDDALKAAGLKS